MKSLKSTRFIVSIVSLVLLAACSSTPKQRAYTDAGFLGENPPAEIIDNKGKKILPNLTREFRSDEQDIQVRPLRFVDFVKTAEEFAFKHNLDADKKAKLIQAFEKSTELQTCFSLSVSGNSSDASDFKFIHAKLQVGDGKILDLSPDDTSEPEKNVHVGSYTTGGYASTIGNTTYVTPSTTHVYSYATYGNSTSYCHKGKLDLTKGFTVYLDRRHELNLDVVDLVWTTDPKQKYYYAVNPGLPSFPHQERNSTHLSRNTSATWERERYEANNKLIRGEQLTRAEVKVGSMQPSK